MVLIDTQHQKNYYWSPVLDWFRFRSLVINVRFLLVVAETKLVKLETGYTAILSLAKEASPSREADGIRSDELAQNDHLSHHEVPREGDGISLLLGRVILPQRVLEELLSVRLGLLLVHGRKDNGSDLERI